MVGIFVVSGKMRQKRGYWVGRQELRRPPPNKPWRGVLDEGQAEEAKKNRRVEMFNGLGINKNGRNNNKPCTHLQRTKEKKELKMKQSIQDIHR